MAEQVIKIESEYIQVDAFLKWAGIASTGGHAKVLVQSGVVSVNGEVEKRRGRKLCPGDRIDIIATDATNGGSWRIVGKEEG